MSVFTGDEGPNTLLGGAGNDTLVGLGGADSLSGAGGADSLDGGAGNDSLTGGGGADTSRGGTGNDSLFGDQGDDLLEGDDGHDFLSDWSGTNTLRGGAGNDTINASSLSVLDGGSGNDSLDAGSGSTLAGGDGDDRLRIADRSMVTGGAGRDTIITPSFFSSFAPDWTIAVSDFAVGATGDAIDFSPLLANAGSDYDGTNPFGMAGFLRLRQDGTDALVEWDSNGGADSFGTLLRLQNVSVGSLTTANLGFDPSGSNAPGQLFTGDEGPNTLLGAAGNDTLVGLGGADSLSGAGGADSLDGGAGNDSLAGGLGADTLRGGTGADSLFGDNGADLLEGDDGDDWLSDWSGAGTLRGGAGNDTISASSLSVLDGGSGDDSLSTWSGSTLAGGDGDDRLRIADRSVVTGGAGRDTIIAPSFLFGGIEGAAMVLRDFAAGATGDAIDFSPLLASAVSGYDGSNPFGTAGFLRLRQDGTDALVEWDSNGGADAFVTLMRLQNVSVANLINENLGFDPSGSNDGLRLTGDEGPNTLLGGSVNDTLVGLGGADSLSGAGGADSLDGGAGNDSLAGGAGADTLRGGTGNDSLFGDQGNDLLEGDEGDDSLSDWSGASTLHGGAGNDMIDAWSLSVLDGGSGNDSLSAGFGSTLAGGDGDDRLQIGVRSVVTGGAGRDTIIAPSLWSSGTESVVMVLGDFAAGATGDVIDFSQLLASAGPAYDGTNPFGTAGFLRLRQDGADALVEWDSNGGADAFVTLMRLQNVTVASLTAANLGFDPSGSNEGLRLTGDEGPNTLLGGSVNDTLVGLGGADSLRGAGGADSLDGGAGNDSLEGGDGADTLRGGADNDSLLGGNGADLLEGDDGHDSLSDWSGASTLRGGAGNDMINASSLSVLDGGSGNDLLNAGSGSTLSGGDGDDMLRGADRSVVTGGAGRDTIIAPFFFESVNANSANVVGDFAVGATGDQIDFGPLLDAFATGYDGTNPFGTAGFLRLRQDGADAVVEWDSNGGANSFVDLLRLQNVTVASLTAANLGFDPSGSNDGLRLKGDQGPNTLLGGAGNDTLVGLGGADSLNGADGNDSLSGGDGDDVLVGGNGNDVLSGGSGFDIASWSDAPGSVSVTLGFSAGAWTSTVSGAAGQDSVASVEEIRGSAFADVLTINDRMPGFLTVVEGAGGADTITGPSVLNSSVVASYRNDTGGGIVADLAAGTVLQASGAVDRLANILHLRGSDFADTLLGSDRNEHLVGGPGNDSLDGRGGTSDWVNYGTLLPGSDGAGVRVSLATGTASGGSGGTDSLAGFENIVGSIGSDTLIGDDLNNSFLPMAGADSIDGGIGFDRVAFDGWWWSGSAPTGAVTVNLEAGTAIGAYGATVQLTSIERVTGTFFADSFLGDATVNRFNGRGGNDTINGGPGADAAEYLNATTGVVVNLATGTALDGEGGTDSLISIAQVVGSNFADTLTGRVDGERSVSLLSGGVGDDLIMAPVTAAELQAAGAFVGVWLTPTAAATVDLELGTVSAPGQGTDLLVNINAASLFGAFNNSLFGTALDNWFRTGEGADTIDGRGGFDTVEFTDDLATGLTGVTISLATGVATDSWGSQDRLISIEGINGFYGADSLVGSDGDNWFGPAAGADTVDGGAGIDTLIYDYGALITIGRGGQTAVAQGVQIDLQAGTAIDPSGTTDLVANFENAIGGSPADTILGSAEANRLEGQGGADLLDGRGGADTLLGGSGNDTLLGGEGNDSLLGGNGSDSLNGGAGDDAFSAGSNDTVAGGTGRDTIIALGTVSAAVLVTDFAAGAGGDRIDFAQLLAATTGYDGSNPFGAIGVLRLTQDAADVLVEWDSNGGANSFVTALRLQNVTVASLTAENLGFTPPAGGVDLSGDGASNTLSGGSGDDTLLGLGGNDSLVGLGGNDSLDGGTDNDTLRGDDGSDVLVGAAGNDSLLGGNGSDTLIGGVGNDTYVVDNAGDRVIEASGDGTDLVLSAVSFNLTGQFIENLTLTGGAAINGTGNGLANLIVGNDAANLLQGLGGADTLDGGLGADTLEGGTGNDVYVVDDIGDRVIEASGAGTDDVLSSVTFNLIGQSIENLTLTGAAAIGGTGNELANRIIGNAAANLLDGGAGADTMQGGTGNDTYVVDNAGDRVIEASGDGTDLVLSSLSFNLTGQFIENLTLTDLAAINGTGNGLANLIVGSGAANLLQGLGGADTLDGGLGADTLEGGTGNDVYVVDDIGDRVIEASGAGTDDVLSSVTFSLIGQSIENLTLTGAAAIGGTGNEMANRIIGNAAANLLDGGAGADTMQGGSGNDTYVVDNAGDRVIEAAGAGTDLVLSSLSFNLTGQAIENLTLTGGAAIHGTGNGLANRITGNNAANLLQGGTGGADTLDGGLGADTLTGGSGPDAFLFSAALGGSNVDHITDFSVPDDHILLSGAIFTGLPTGAVAASAFVIGPRAADALDRIIYNSATGALLYDADGTGAGEAVQFARLNAGLALTAADFIVI